LQGITGTHKTTRNEWVLEILMFAIAALVVKNRKIWQDYVTSELLLRLATKQTKKDEDRCSDKIGSQSYGSIHANQKCNKI
jgi:hypothetical protein